MALNVPGLLGMIAFYVVIMVVGFVAARYKSKKHTDSDDLLLAGRDLGLFVASLSSAATMVGGGYINGTAESMARDGFIWSIAPITYNTGVAMAAIFYAPKVRRARYNTIFDPMQKKYGDRWGAFLFFSEFLSDLFWEAAILSALGTTLAIILDLDTTISIVVSACVAVLYTFFGGLFAVAYTDVIQLFFIAFGLILCIPFAADNPNVDLSRIHDNWLGRVETGNSEYNVGLLVDLIVVTAFGGIPWQAFYQRMLACRSPSMARSSTLIGVGISISMVIPTAVIGAIGASTDWNGTDYFDTRRNLTGNATLEFTEWLQVLPLVMNHLCPPAVSVIGIGAISAAVMSSADSICLAIASIFSRNIYKNVFRPTARDTEIIWVFRLSILVTGILGTVIAISANSVYGLFILCGDLMLIIQFPQLTCALWVKFSNTYGSIAGVIVGLILRVIGGEAILKIPVVVKYPMYDEINGIQSFPFKTLAMVGCFLSILVVSYITDVLFRNEILSKKFDILNCFAETYEVTPEKEKDFIKLKYEIDVDPPEKVEKF